MNNLLSLANVIFIYVSYKSCHVSRYGSEQKERPIVLYNFRPRLLQALIGLFELPEDDSVPADEHFIEIDDTPGIVTFLFEVLHQF